MTIKERIQDRRVGVLGMARSGVAAALLARRHGASVFVSDSGEAESLNKSMQDLSSAGIEFETGGHTDKILDADYLVVSPGVPLDVPILTKAAERGLPLFSEIELASWLCPGRIVGITGSNGKTTTTVLLGEILRAAGMETFVCGNIGLPFSEIVDKMSERSVAVIELSSFQLMTIEDFRPHVAVILNVTPDHLDRHHSFEEYRAAKYRITENQTAEDFLLLNADDATLSAADLKTKAAICQFSIAARDDTAISIHDGQFRWRRGDKADEIIPVDRILLPGEHNLQNVAACVLASRLLDVPGRVLSEVLSSFKGVEHRLEEAGIVAGIRFINDSKATNVDSVCVALESLTPSIYLIAGGRDKGVGYQPIIKAGADKVKGIVAIGEARDKIFDQLGRCMPVEFAGSMQDAVERCFALAVPGDTVLLSPGCASFDMFDNFEQRGRAFKEAVKTLNNGKKKSETLAN